MQERVRQREREPWRLQRPQVRSALALARVVVVLQVVEVPQLVLLLAVQVVPLLAPAQAVVLLAWLASFWEKPVRILRAA